MPNAWNAGSARLLADAGFAAIATTSAGIAYALGLPDAAGRVGRERMMQEIRGIADSVDLPVNADLENGYGAAPEAVADTIRQAIAAGAAGGNIEDYTGDERAPLYETGLAVERVRAACAAARSDGSGFVVTGRTDCYLVGHPDPFGESVRRANLYREAGADCLYAPGVRDAATIGALVREIAGPLNVVMGLAGAPIGVAELQALGVRRISIGGSLARATFGLVRRAAQEMRESGTFGYAAGQIPDAELGAFFAACEARKG